MFLPSILPEELLAFYLMRVEHLNYGQKHRLGSRNLLGLPSRRIDGWLPTFVDKVEDILGPALGLTHQQIIHNHTLYPYFASACRPSRADVLALRMTSRHSGPTRFCLALTDSEFRTLSFRLCIECAKRDLETFGVAYAHRQHHLPYIHHCNEHAQVLVQHQWNADPDFNAVRKSPCKQGLRFTALSTYKLHVPSDHLLTIRKLVASGFILESGNSRKKAIREALVETWPDGFGDEHLDSWFLSDIGQYRLHSALHARQTSLHPVIGVLFESISMAAQIQLPLDLQRPARAERTPPELLQAMRDAVIGGRSLSRTAREAGVSIKTLQVFMSRAGDNLKFRPSVLTTARRAELLKQLRVHDSVAAAAKAVGLSASTAYRVASLHSKEIAAVRLEKRRACAASRISEWRQLAASNPNFGRTALRGLNPGLYAWLYKNQREVLFETPVTVATRPIGRRPARIAPGDLLLVARAHTESTQTSRRPSWASAQQLAIRAGVNIGSLRTAVTRKKGALQNEALSDFHIRRLTWSFNQLLLTPVEVVPWRIRKQSGLRTTTTAPYGQVVDSIMTEMYNWANPRIHRP